MRHGLRTKILIVQYNTTILCNSMDSTITVAIKEKSFNYIWGKFFKTLTTNPKSV